MIDTSMQTVFLLLIVFLFIMMLLVSRSITMRFLRNAQPDSLHEGTLWGSIRTSFEKLIRRASVDLFPSELVSLMVLLGVLAYVLAFNFGMASLVSLLFGLVGACLPPLALLLRKNKQAAKFDQQMAEAMPMIASNLRTGLSLRQSILPIREAMGDPIRSELDRFRDDIAKGLSTAEAVSALAERTQSEDMAMFASAVKVQEEHGGSIADVVEQVGVTIRERNELRLMIETKTGTAKISVYVMIFVPIVVGCILCASSEIYLSFYTTPIGFLVIGLCAISMFIGYLIMRKMADIEI